MTATAGQRPVKKQRANSVDEAYSHSYPVHTKTTPSPLSKEAPPESYRGFVNLGMLLLFGNNVRLIIENYVKYGFLLSIPGSKVSRQDWILAGLTHALLPLNLLFAYQLERWAMKLAIGFHKRGEDMKEVKLTALANGNGDNVKKPKKSGKESLEMLFKANQKTVGWLHVFNLFAIIAWPSFMSYYMILHPFLAMSCLLNGCILFLKMISYVLVNRDLRAAYILDLPLESFVHTKPVHTDSKETGAKEATPAAGEEDKAAVTDNNAPREDEKLSASPEPLEPKKDDTVAINKDAKKVYAYQINYPDNIVASNVLYFWWAPTLCYQPSYPRTTEFRKSFFFKRVAEMVTALGMMYFLIEQYATPTLQNSVRAFDNLEFGIMLERVLKLSTTSVIIWLLMFYVFFHSCFNALAEILYFGDRVFYLAWWNSGSLATYWRLWNRPVYTFFKRHVYLPLLSRGYSATMASFIIFTISALLHEVLIGFPTHMILGYAFAGMFFQIPLIALTKPLEKWRGVGTGLGNMIFWVSFTILGQPACALLYYYHWTKRHMDDGVTPISMHLPLVTQ